MGGRGGGYDPVMLLLLLAACTPTKVPADAVSAEDSPGRDSIPTVPGDTGSPNDSGDPDTADDDPAGCSDLYDPDVLQAFSIEITDADWAALEADYASGAKNYHPVTLGYHAGEGQDAGDEVVDAMIRLKGNPSFSWYDPKMQFVIAFNEEDSSGRFHGQRKISLDASWYEPTMVRDRVSWAVMRRFSETATLPFACSNSATLTVNGAYYGAYTNIEYFDHEWLERSFGDEGATGTLWKYGTDPVSNAEASDGSAIRTMNSTTDMVRLAELGDLGEWVNEFAAEAVLGDDDGYWCCNHNYYLYEHPTRGILFIPWDFDDNFDVQGYDADPITGYDQAWGLFQQPHYRALTSDPVYGPKFVDAVEAMNAAMDPELTLADIDGWAAQVSDAVETDPMRSIGWQEHLDSLERMRAWVTARHAFIDSWVACQRGETTDADGDGSPVCTDPHDMDATVHPAAAEVCNGVDDDADGWIDDPADTPADPPCDDCARHDFTDRHFLFCRNPRTNEDAEANCASRGGTLTAYRSTGEYYMYFFYTWPITEPWWTAAGNGLCGAWDESTLSATLTPCGEEHPSVCSVP